MTRTGLRSVFVLSVVVAMAVFAQPLIAAAAGQEDWKAEFEDVCSRTGQAAGLTPEEITGLMNRCDNLKPRIEKLDESTAKVYLKRLQMCRDFYAFLRESASR